MKTVTGDLLKLAEQGMFHCIVQGCNCWNTMGSGIAKQIRARYPEAYAVDQKTIAGDRKKLGTFTVMLGKQFNIINAYTQYNFNTGGQRLDVFEYDAFQQILDKLVEEYPGCNFGFPLIGCGLAGGDKTRIIRMLEQFAEKIEATYGSVTLVEFKS